MAAESGRIAGFDGIRAIAFLGVFANHKLLIPQRDALGCMGVWTFFALSGFLITGILVRSRQQMEAGGLPFTWALGRFYLRRTARIFPVYYCFLAVLFLVSMFVTIPNFWRPEKIASAFYVINFLVGWQGHWIGDFGHLWSLAVEEQFYLLFAPLVLLTPSRRVAVVCTMFMLAGLVTKVAMEASAEPSLTIYVNSLVNFGMLGYGGLIGIAASGMKAPAWLVSGPAQAAVAASLIASPLLFGGAEQPWLRYAPALVLFSGLLLFQVAQAQSSWFVSLLELAPLRKLGRVSYAAYLFHPLIHFESFQHLLRRVGLDWSAPRAVAMAVELAVTVILATISWNLLERPILEWAARVTSRRPFAPLAAHRADRGAAGSASATS
jgi:peptidoglycan/LPS O-acetylase OafA/YrhL